MKKNILVAILSLIASTGILSQAQAGDSEETVESLIPFVTALPSFQDLGNVKGSRFTTVTFINNSFEEVPFFSAYCMGDLSAFNCSSFCNRLSPGGSCTVHITFTARNADGMRKAVTVHGSGSGTFATATVYATDARD